LSAHPIVEELAGIVGASQVLVGDTAESHLVDWTRRYVGRSRAVVRPGSTDEVVRIIEVCRRHGVPVVPQGGNTGLVGGSVPDESGTAIVLSTRRLDTIGNIDELAGQVTVGAGVTLAAVEAAVSATPWEVPVDLGARDTATVGGMVATNAGGLRVVRHGTMRSNVVGIEAVLGTGSVVSHLTGLPKDNTGYDLGGLLCGSEGTLGIVTAVRLRLVPRVTERLAVFTVAQNWHDAVNLAREVRLRLRDVEEVEALDRSCVGVVHSELGVHAPITEEIDHDGVAVVVVTEHTADAIARLEKVLVGRPHAVAFDPAGVRRIRAVRERVTEAIARRGVAHKFDVSLPATTTPEFVERAKSMTMPAETYVFGHLGDGNLHLNIVDPSLPLEGPLLGLVAELGGSISAEHGIGRMKSPWIHLARSTSELEAFRSVKSALDPDGIMNPGVLLGAEI
jgi:FAD/FMN-containing dehydrogenase